MKYLFPFAAVAALVAAPVLGAPAPGWIVDKTKSRIGFAGTVNGQGFQGSFRRYDAAIAFDPANLAGSSVTATIDLASAVTGDKTRDEALPTADWFNTKVSPRAVFSAKSFRALGGNRYQANGTLTIRGKARAVVLPFQLAITGKSAKMNGALALDRRWFGVGQRQFATTDMVAAKVVVSVSLAATRR